MQLEDLKELRLARGMSQTEAAVAVGVSLTAYLLWERGAGKPNPENMAKLMEVFGHVIPTGR